MYLSGIQARNRRRGRKEVIEKSLIKVLFTEICAKLGEINRNWG